MAPSRGRDGKTKNRVGGKVFKNEKVTYANGEESSSVGFWMRLVVDDVRECGRVVVTLLYST